MANSTWLALTNECLRYSILKTIPGATQFNDDNQLLEYQWAAKYYVRLSHQLLTLRATKHFAQRRIQLNTESGTNTYNLDTGISASGLKFRSFWNVTAGGSQNGEIYPLDYTRFLEDYPDQSVITTGAPKQWVLLPVERTDVSPVYKVRLIPTPDAAYELQYRAQISPYQLTEAVSIVLWPPDYEHCLTMFSWAMVERALGEGKEGVIQQLAQKAVSDVQLIAGVPEDLKRAIRTMGDLRNTKNGRWPPGRDTGWVSSPLG